MEASPRDWFEFRVASSRSSDATSRRELVVPLVQVRDEHREVLCRERGEARVAGLGPQLDDDEQAEDERHGGDRELVASAAHHFVPADAPGPGDALATGCE